uniref:Protein turtle n=1 Tax=Timema tahoe TaxID=61484 RepID=A0A7R9IBC8_9NEOP|nr:unnamed protein product [Timema tahoe]
MAQVLTLYAPPRVLNFLNLISAFSLALLEEDKRASFLTANVGEYAVFNCQLDFPNDIEIPYKLRWKKEGTVVFSWYKDEEPRATPDYQGRINLLPHDSPYGRGSINLTSIRESDGGWYECSVFFPNRSPSTRPNGTWYHLTVDGKIRQGSPTISPTSDIVPGGTLLAIPPINQTTLEGEPAHFPCVTKDRDGRVTWYKDGVPLSELPDLEERSTVSQEGSLTIQETDIDDPGEYHCVVTNSLGERQTAGAFLNVLYKAKALTAPREVYLPFGKPGVLDCNFRANPPLTNLRWDKNGFLYDPYNVQGVFYSRNGSLFFSKVEEIHSGHYTCTPFNDLGTEGPSAAMTVIVQKAPVFTITPNNLYLKKLGDTLEMPCDAVDGTKDHRPTIVWFKKDGTPLPLDRIMIQNGNLTIERIQQSDDGLYSCVASNEVATITADTEVAIETTSPRAPYNLTASASHSSVTLRWMAGTGRANMEFLIWYRPADAPQWRTMKILTRGVTQATINSLDPGRIYEFMVLSQDKKGDGMFSKAIQIRTRGSDQGNNVTSAQQYHSPLGSFQQIGPPRNVSVSPSRDGYLVTWEPPDLGMEDLLNYHVRWSQEGKEHLHGQAEVTTNRYLGRIPREVRINSSSPSSHSLVGPALEARASHLSRVVTRAIYFCSQKRPYSLHSTFPCVREWDNAHCAWQSNSPLLVRTSGGAHVLAHVLLTVRISTGALKRLTTRRARPRPADPEPQEPGHSGPELQGPGPELHHVANAINRRRLNSLLPRVQHISGPPPPQASS